MSDEVAAPAAEAEAPAAPERPSLFVPDAPEEAPAEPEAQPEAELEAEPQAPAEDPQKRAFEDMARREQQLLAKERQFAGLTRAQQLLADGKHKEAAAALGIDPHKLLADYWGEDMLPAKEAPTVDQQVGEVRQALEQTRQELARSQAQMARYQIYNKLQAEMGNREDLETVRMLASKGGERFFDQLVDYAAEQYQTTGQAPSWGEVLEHAENTYAERYCDIGQDLLQLKKIRAKLGLDELPQATDKQPPPKPASPRKTLTNAGAAESPRTVIAPKTDAERRALALEAIRKGYKQ